MSPLDCQQKIDMGLMSGNQFGLLGDNGNPNRLKPKTWLWSPRHQIKKRFLLSLSEEKMKFSNIVEVLGDTSVGGGVCTFKLIEGYFSFGLRGRIVVFQAKKIRCI